MLSIIVTVNLLRDNIKNIVANLNTKVRKMLGQHNFFMSEANGSITETENIQDDKFAINFRSIYVNKHKQSFKSWKAKVKKYYSELGKADKDTDISQWPITFHQL